MSYYSNDAFVPEKKGKEKEEKEKPSMLSQPKPRETKDSDVYGEERKTSSVQAKQDGELIYVKLDFGNRDHKASQSASNEKPAQETTSSEVKDEPVEYSAVDFAATAQRKEEAEAMGGQLAYVNTKGVVDL